MHEDLKENSLLPSLLHFHPSIPPLSWLSRASALHWPFGSRVWKNKLRRKGQEQRPTSNDTEERRADVLPAAWPFAPIMDVWCRLAHTLFFPDRNPTSVSGHGMWRDSVGPLPGQPRRHEESLCCGCSSLHVNFHSDHTHKSSSRTFHPPTVRHRYASWSAPSSLTAEGGVLTRWTCRVKSNRWRSSGPSCPKASPLGSASAQVGRKVRYLNCDKSLGKYQVTEMPVWAYVPNFLLIVWIFSGSTPTASLTACKSLRWKSWSWAAQVLEGLSHHIKASGNQQVIFDPQDPWVLVALKAFGTLEDRQKHRNDTKTSQWSIWIVQMKIIRKLFCQT